METRHDQDEPTLGDEQAGQGKEEAVQALEDEQAAVDGDGGDARHRAKCRRLLAH